MKIALVGYARSGKDTFARLIQEIVPPTVLLAFADEMKKQFHKTFMDIPTHPKPREGYEKFGAAMRDIDELVWIKTLERSYKPWAQTDVNIVITDVRQVNEANWARDNGFLIVKVTAPDDARRARSDGETEFFTVNNSERDLWMIDPDYHISNSGTIHALEKSVVSLLHWIAAEKAVTL